MDAEALIRCNALIDELAQVTFEGSPAGDPLAAHMKTLVASGAISEAGVQTFLAQIKKLKFAASLDDEKQLHDLAQGFWPGPEGKKIADRIAYLAGKATGRVWSQAPVCDFCDAPDPRRLFPGGDILIPVRGPGGAVWARSIGGWAACGQCEPVVERARVKHKEIRRLVDYRVAIYVKSQPEWNEQTLRAVARGVSNMYKELIPRLLPPRDISPVDAAERSKDLGRLNLT